MHWIDPDYLPATLGTVERLVPNPRGDVDGIILIDEAGRRTLVHVPPHLTEQVTAAVRVGDKLSVRGVRPRGGAVVSAVALIAASGRAVVDNGPPHTDEIAIKETELERVETDAAGIVALALHGPKGELRGALLSDGSVLRIGPKEAPRFAALLRPDAAVAARGKGLRTAYGLVIEAREIGPSLDRLEPVKPPKAKESDQDRRPPKGKRTAKDKPPEEHAGPDV